MILYIFCKTSNNFYTVCGHWGADTYLMGALKTGPSTISSVNDEEGGRGRWEAGGMKSGVDGGPCRRAGDRWDERMVVLSLSLSFSLCVCVCVCGRSHGLGLGFRSAYQSYGHGPS
jgi:hypothetical protein